MAQAALAPDSFETKRWHARWLLALFLVVGAFFVAVSLSPLRQGFADAPSRGPTDVELYQAEVERIRAGESYYEAVAHELPERGYPTASVFNWRTPLPVWLVAKMPESSTATVIIGVAALGLVAASFKLLADEGSTRTALLSVLLLSGAILPCLMTDLVVVSELWSGVLIALSACWFGNGNRRAGLLSGIAALFFRELAAPYVVICMALAVYERRFRELAWWFAGLAAYAVFFAFHAHSVSAHAITGQPGLVSSWIKFGAAPFLISAAQMNGYLLLLPQWVAAVFLACAFLGAATWNTHAGRLISLTVVIYAVAFSVAGNDFNQYWGSMIAPLLAIAAARAPAAVRGLVEQSWPAARTGVHAAS
ncbi:MAG TPA: hypothetical protein VL175_11010 [Pirellulales bacterium]|jgi:hypothetical protein|nr:hypothetical protein [Pirellulales bacterium]